MFDEEEQFDLREHAAEDAMQAQAAARGDGDEGLGMAAFDDVLSDPTVAKVAPAALVERAVAATRPQPPPPRFQPVMPQRGPMVEAPSPREQVYVSAMGPRPGRGNKALGLDAKTESNLAGLSLLAVGLGAAVGAGFWGIRGGAAGSLAAGSLLNAYRATKASSAGEKSEAMLSATYAILGAGVAGYLIWSHKRAGKDREE